MKNSNVEARLAALEAEVALLRQKLHGDDKEEWWNKISGTFANDPAYEEAMKLGRQYRESTRPKSRKKRKRRNGDS